MNTVKKKIVIGTWSLSGDLGKVDKKEAIKILDYCIDNNFKEFDIAPTYGYGIIDDIFSRYKNYKLKINTKFGYDSERKKNFSISILRASINKSYDLHGKINTVFLHNPRLEIKDWKKTIEFMQNLKSKKIVNSIGISLARDYYFDKKILNEFDVVQDEINLLRLGNLIYRKNKFQLMARSPLATGILSNKFSKFSKYEKQDYRNGWLKGQRKKNILNQKKKLIQIFGKNLTDASYAYLLNHDKINKIIFGVKNLNHVNFLKRFDKLKIISSVKICKLKKLHDQNFGFKTKNLY